MTKEKYCTYCGAKNVSGNVFCENCGQSFDDQKNSQRKTSVYSTQSRYQPYQTTQSTDSQTSISGSFDAVPGQESPYLPHQRRGMPTFVKVLMSIFFMVIPLLFFLFFYVFRDFGFP